MYDAAKKELNLVSKSENIIPGIDNVPTSTYPLRMIKRKHIFPLKTVKIRTKKFSSPFNSQKYLSLIYGANYMKIPKILPIYKLIYAMGNVSGIDEKLKVYLGEIKKTNENFNK